MWLIIEEIVYRCNSPYHSRYWNMFTIAPVSRFSAGCNRAYRLRYWNNTLFSQRIPSLGRFKVTTVLIVYGMRRRVRDSRGAERRWGPHISYLSKAKAKRKWSGNSAYRSWYAPKMSALLLPERSEGKTKVIKQQCLLFMVLKFLAVC